MTEAALDSQASPDDPRSRLVDDPLWRHRGSRGFSEHDERGFRPSGDYERAEVLLTGSSHIYGTNLKASDTWPKLLADRGLACYSAAMGAWSLMQYALVARDLLRPQHRLFVVCLYTGFDIYATLKHTIQTSSEFSKPFLGSLPLPTEPSWAWREERTAFLQSQREQGLSETAALGLARERGFADTHAVEVGGEEWWLEPNLRIATMDLEAPFIGIAFDLAIRYLEYIRGLCARTHTRLLIVVQPTKEYVVASALDLGARDPVLARLVAVEDRLVQGLAGRAGRIADAVHDLAPTYVAAMAEGRMFDAVPFEGHPSASGAQVIADVMLPLIRRHLR